MSRFSNLEIVIETDARGRILGTDADELAYGTEGGDTINLRAGDDVIFGGLGDDLLVGLAGSDLLVGGFGDDVLNGGAHADSLFGGIGDDSLFGQRGDDLIRGGAGGDFLIGAEGDDTIRGGAGNDDLNGESGDDALIGGAGNDIATGGDGEDRVVGGAGRDLVTGGADDDIVRGGAGNDFVFGDGGDDILFGGAGRDFFALDASDPDEGRDRIADFALGTDALFFDIDELLAGDPGLTEAVIEGGGSVDAVWAAADASELFFLETAANGDLILGHPSGTARLAGVPGEDVTSFADLADSITIAGLGETLTGIAGESGNPATVADLLAASGTGFDDDGSDFDILNAALEATELDALVADPEQNLTVFAPDDDAFISTAQALGFTGTSEEGALDFAVGVLAELGGGDPIPPLTDILAYHAADAPLTLGEARGFGTLATLAGPELEVEGTTVIDNDPDFPDAEITTPDIITGNGVVHVVSEVLLPFDV